MTSVRAGEGMEYQEVVMGRRSIRGFLDKPVSKQMINEVLSMAIRAPSSLNTQPWNFYVVSGAPLDAIRKGNTERNLAGVPDSREFRGHGAYEGDHRIRQIEIAKQLFAAMSIEREDKAARQDWVLRGFRQFDAPVSIVVTYDRSIHGGDIAPFDCGGVTNALVNAAWSKGLGCVINSQGIMQSPVVREHAGIPDDQVIMICVAMGYPDETFPANAVVSRRKSLDEAVHFVGFDTD
jgi:nitroreductase